MIEPPGKRHAVPRHIQFFFVCASAAHDSMSRLLFILHSGLERERRPALTAVIFSP